MRHFIIHLVIVSIALISTARAQELESAPVKNDVATASLIASSSSISKQNTLWISLHLEMPDDWHTYWINPGDTGLPAHITPTLPDGASLGPIHWPTPQRFEIAGLINYGYHGDVDFLMPLSLDEKSSLTSVPLKLKAQWLVCKDICIPESAELMLDIPVTDSIDNDLSPRFKALVEALPKPMKNTLYNYDEKNVWLELDGGSPDVSFFPQNEAMVSTALPRVISQPHGMVLVFERGAEATKTGFAGLVVNPSASGVDAAFLEAIFDADFALPTATKPTKTLAESGHPSYALALLLAFLGGLILNGMPCVLPVLSLKLLALVKKAGLSRADAATHGMAYTLGILLSFLTVAGVLILLQKGGAALGWGYQLQSPVFVLGLATVMFAVGLNLSGVFSIPSILGNLGQDTASKETPAGSFMTGVLATLVATPCTAPFMASAIGYALTLPALAALGIFAMIALGLASPYLLVSLFPALRRWLPKPGLWMETLRQLLAFPMYATAAWLLWVLATQAGPDALALGFAWLLLIAFAAWASRGGSSIRRKLILLILLLLAAGWLVTQVHDMQAPATISLEAETFSEEKLSTFIKQGRPVLVNVTANWCITCKVNERVAFSAASVAEHFQRQNITVLKADWTNRSAAISKYIGQFGRSGVPTYVFYPPHGEPHLLPQLLSPSSLIEETQF
ncbi:MAG: thioredoxin family protein [Rickettsiales bacterium]|nr:thioredoxin family protein [Rickettsiales bacterium]